MQQIVKASYFAARKHMHQRRKGIEAAPYINHPLAVADLLTDIGHISDEAIIIASLLHDTIEDTETTAEEIKLLFGQTVLNYVLEVTDDKTLPKAERKRLQIAHAPLLTPGAKLIKLADKIDNIRSIIYTPPQDWSLVRRREYLEWAYSVFAGLQGINIALDNMFLEKYHTGTLKI